ncbi:MAG: 1-(5-phosphoribosyl)-5-[(5-phosphoribosylamino)methylideneamino]imidazole-4-carboxamide isomerase [Actinomycetota bacterium]
MGFTVLPAIDVSAGRLSVYTKEGPQAVDAFDGDPVAAATAFVRAGARWLHVVDMDLAFHGQVRNAEVVSEIRRALPDARVQASGGIVRWEDAARFLDAGADRFVLGSAALVDEDATAEVLHHAAGRVLAGLEVEGGRVRARGRDDVDLDLMATVGWLAMLPLPGFLVTAVDRVGSLTGPDVALVARVARVGPTFAAGGIRTLEDLEALRDVRAVGAVVGRAAADGGLDLEAALAWSGV